MFKSRISGTGWGHTMGEWGGHLSCFASAVSPLHLLEETECWTRMNHSGLTQHGSYAYSPRHYGKWCGAIGGGGRFNVTCNFSLPPHTPASQSNVPQMYSLSSPPPPEWGLTCVFLILKSADDLLSPSSCSILCSIPVEGTEKRSLFQRREKNWVAPIFPVCQTKHPFQSRSSTSYLEAKGHKAQTFLFSKNAFMPAKVFTTWMQLATEKLGLPTCAFNIYIGER